LNSIGQNKKTVLLALVPFFVLIILFELVPLITVIVRSFFPQGEVGFTLQNYTDIFSKKLYRDAVINSIQISAISSLIGMVIAFLGAKAAHSATDKTKNAFMSVLNMTSNFAGIPLAFAFIILMGNVGVLVMLGKTLGLEWLANFDLYSYNGLLLTYIYFQVPLATLLLMPAFDGLKKEWRESVSLMGGSGFYYWFRVGIPNLLPSILGTISMLFANAIAAYATAYALLAGNYSLLPIRISEQFVGDVVQHKEFGSALAVVLILLMVAATSLNNTILRRQRWKKAK
jgi:putative spermidine/putrescine transport system permease protein